MATKHEVGRSVILHRPSTTDITEFSRAVSMQQMNGVQVEAWYKFVTPAKNPTLNITLEGSNDLAQWTDVSLSSSVSFSGSTIDHQVTTASSTVPWQFVRLRYVLTGVSSDVSVTFATTIKIFEEA